MGLIFADFFFRWSLFRGILISRVIEFAKIESHENSTRLFKGSKG